MKLTKKQLSVFRYDEWKSWVYDSKEDHFFFLCPLHIIFLIREGIDLEGQVHGNYTCAYPGCLKKATNEFYPNLITAIKKSNEDFKNGKGISIEDVFKKCNKKVKLSSPNAKRGDKRSKKTSTDRLAK